MDACIVCPSMLCLLMVFFPTFLPALLLLLFLLTYFLSTVGKHGKAYDTFRLLRVSRKLLLLLFSIELRTVRLWYVVPIKRFTLKIKSRRSSSVPPSVTENNFNRNFHVVDRCYPGSHAKLFWTLCRRTWLLSDIDAVIDAWLAWCVVVLGFFFSLLAVFILTFHSFKIDFHPKNTLRR